MVKNKLYIICKRCDHKIDLSISKSCPIYCPICKDSYYVSYFIDRISVYDERNGGFYTDNLILDRTYFRWN